MAITSAFLLVRGSFGPWRARARRSSFAGDFFDLALAGATWRARFATLAFLDVFRRLGCRGGLGGAGFFCCRGHVFSFRGDYRAVMTSITPVERNSKENLLAIIGNLGGVGSFLSPDKTKGNATHAGLSRRTHYFFRFFICRRVELRQKSKGSMADQDPSKR
jgi:hypothetical protein